MAGAITGGTVTVVGVGVGRGIADDDIKEELACPAPEAPVVPEAKTLLSAAPGVLGVGLTTKLSTLTRPAPPTTFVLSASLTSSKMFCCCRLKILIDIIFSLLNQRL
jgi:hypothetical protein